MTHLDTAPTVRRTSVRRLVAACLAALATTAPAAAQSIPPDEFADLALETCIRSDPNASEGVRVPGFSVRDRLGRTAVYSNDAGATLTLTARPGFFSCEMRMPQASPDYLAVLLARLDPAIQKRFGETRVNAAEDGMVWVTTTELDVLVTIEAMRSEDGTVSVTSSADNAPLAPPTQ